HAEIYDISGRLFASYTSERNPINASVNFEPSQYNQTVKFGERIQHSAFPILSKSNSQEQVGTITIHMDLSAAYRNLFYEIGILLLIGLICLALFSTLLTRLQKSITQPLLSLTSVMRKVGKEGDFSSRSTLSSQDEIGELSNVFNQMLDELSRRELSLHEELKERRHIEERLSEIAHFDPVTRLPNRNSFNSQIDRALLNYKYEHEKFALLFLDLDNFKYVNDTFGHHAGDLVLLNVAERLRGLLRQEDFVARLGGDEFVIIMSDFSELAPIISVAEKIITALQQPFFVDGHEAFVGTSIGIATCPEHGEDGETLQRQADSAMYQAKSLGKNNFQFYQDDLSHMYENRIATEALLRHSLERKEIVVLYQPIFEISTQEISTRGIATQKIAGFEALVRWRKSDGTLIQPDEFIPLSEEIGFIVNLGDFVMNTAVRQTAEWVERFGPTFTAVNYSSKQFKQNNLTQKILDALKAASLHPRYLEMEITETVLMDNSSDSMSLLSLLVKQGMNIVIDDFGTGYSSLSYLINFPVSKIKIDRSFIAKLPTDKNALAVVTAIINLAQSLNLKTVAEGIETPEQLACLTKLGCNLGQGYLLGHPLSAEAATQLLEIRQTLLA
ncbi:MAG: EAL domain-containing protein, partial [Gallionella sp.]